MLKAEKDRPDLRGNAIEGGYSGDPALEKRAGLHSPIEGNRCRLVSGFIETIAFRCSYKTGP
jgi:hypothetical protein